MSFPSRLKSCNDPSKRLGEILECISKMALNIASNINYFGSFYIGRPYGLVGCASRPTNHKEHLQLLGVVQKTAGFGVSVRTPMASSDGRADSPLARNQSEHWRGEEYAK